MSYAQWYVDEWGFWATRLVDGDRPQHFHMESAKEVNAATGFTITSQHRIYDADPAGAKHPTQHTLAPNHTSPHTAAKKGPTLRQRLRRQERSLEERIASLKHAYMTARADQHVLRNNIVRKTRAAERRLDEVERALTALNVKSRRNKAYAAGHRQSKGPIVVALTMSTDGDSFSPTVAVKPGATVWVRALITIADRNWAVGRLGMPDMVRVRWSRPARYKNVDDLGFAGHDEYLVSNPLTLTRKFRAPAQKPTGGSFGCHVETYELLLDSTPSGHQEGTQ